MRQTPSISLRDLLGILRNAITNRFEVTIDDYVGDKVAILNFTWGGAPKASIAVFEDYTYEISSPFLQGTPRLEVYSADMTTMSITLSRVVEVLNILQLAPKREGQ